MASKGLTFKIADPLESSPALGEMGELGDWGRPAPLPPLLLNDLGRVKKDGRSDPLASHRCVLSLTDTSSWGGGKGLSYETAVSLSTVVLSIYRDGHGT